MTTPLEQRPAIVAVGRLNGPSGKLVPASPEGGNITVPDVAGLDHQAAQDALQGEGLWILDEKDATGQGRLLLWDRNWEVVRTDPPAGTTVSDDTVITIFSKKQGE
jgi:beta-lactam-binding protein with PASTA domain